MVFFHNFVPDKDVNYILLKKPPLLLSTVILIYFLSLEQIAYFLTQEAVYLLIHFKFLRVQLWALMYYSTHQTEL